METSVEQIMIDTDENGEIIVILPASVETDLNRVAETFGNTPSLVIELYKEQIKGAELASQLFCQMVAKIEEQETTINELKERLAVS